MQDDGFLKSVLDEKREYERVIQSLSPCDVPCIYCGHSHTQEHGCYEREPQITDEAHIRWSIHRRLCPACEKTFSLMPICLAPFQRVFIQVQDAAVSLLAGRDTVEQVVERLSEIGMSISESTVRRWYARLRVQVEAVLKDVWRWVQAQRPDATLPPLRVDVRNPEVFYYYERLLMVPAHTGHVIATLGRNFPCSSSVTVNRVSFVVNPGRSP